jgi:hypothetical protein
MLELQFNKVSKSTRVIISNRASIAKGFQNGIGFQNYTNIVVNGVSEHESRTMFYTHKQGTLFFNECSRFPTDGSCTDSSHQLFTFGRLASLRPGEGAHLFFKCSAFR